MSEYLPSSPEKYYSDISFDIASTVMLNDSTELLLGHTHFGDFRLQAAPSKDNPHPHQLQAYHSVEPAILSHIVMQVIRCNPAKSIRENIEDILARERNVPIGALRYPGRPVDESIDRQYHKASPQLARLLASGTQSEIPSLDIGQEGSLKGHLYHYGGGILITNEIWDDTTEIEIDDEDDDISLADIPRLEVEVAHIDNEDLPAFAAALIATARTDYGRVKHRDMITTLRSVL